MQPDCYQWHTALRHSCGLQLATVHGALQFVHGNCKQRQLLCCFACNCAAALQAGLSAWPALLLQSGSSSSTTWEAAGRLCPGCEAAHTIPSQPTTQHHLTSSQPLQQQPGQRCQVVLCGGQAAGRGQMHTHLQGKRLWLHADVCCNLRVPALFTCSCCQPVKATNLRLCLDMSLYNARGRTYSQLLLDVRQLISSAAHNRDLQSLPCNMNESHYYWSPTGCLSTPTAGLNSSGAPAAHRPSYNPAVCQQASPRTHHTRPTQQAWWWAPAAQAAPQLQSRYHPQAPAAVYLLQRVPVVLSVVVLGCQQGSPTAPSGMLWSRALQA